MKKKKKKDKLAAECIVKVQPQLNGFSFGPSTHLINKKAARNKAFDSKQIKTSLIFTILSVPKPLNTTYRKPELQPLTFSD